MKRSSCIPAKDTIGFARSLIKGQDNITFKAGEMSWNMPNGSLFKALFRYEISGLQGTLFLDYDWNTPQGNEHVAQKVNLSAHWIKSRFASFRLWHFYCPLKNCGRQCHKLFIGKNQEFGCKKCAAVLQRSWSAEVDAKEHRMSKFLKNPDLIQQTLLSNYANPKDKLGAMDALEELEKRAAKKAKKARLRVRKQRRSMFAYLRSSPEALESFQRSLDRAQALETLKRVRLKSGRIAHAAKRARWTDQPSPQDGGSSDRGAPGSSVPLIRPLYRYRRDEKQTH